MPFLLTIVGLIMVVTGVKDTQSQLSAQLVKDFTGSGNFIYWILALFAIGSIGYAPALEKFSRVFMALCLLSLFLANGGFFQQFTSAIQSGTSKAPAPSQAGSYGSPSGGSSSGGSSGGSTLSSLGTIAELAALA